MLWLWVGKECRGKCCGEAAAAAAASASVSASIPLPLYRCLPSCNLSVGLISHYYFDYINTDVLTCVRACTVLFQDARRWLDVPGSMLAKTRAAQNGRRVCNSIIPNNTLNIDGPVCTHSTNPKYSLHSTKY